ncbi:hypothetical protein F5876DRAFT_68280 [Lentinula aff. lateritia]|uniref:Uncharacterized protein n=1 Tax=Lentinula aff. lateritia TaxID=2804960 RepID=A0ACC1TRP2_9AGAR|nr:hypothetical protein F5876DRAFT_68280 [Lentinula aff. lateritia]
MSIPIHSRPLDPSLLEDGLVSGLSSNMSSVGFGKSPESAMVDEIFNNPDVWSIQFDEERNADSAGAVDSGLNSGSSMSSMLKKGPTQNECRDSRDMVHISGSSTKKRRPNSARVPEGYHLKRRSKLQLEAFTLRPFESRHRVMPYLSSASSVSDSSSIASSTPSLNSSLPTISDEDSLRSNLKSVKAPVKWRGMQDIDEGPHNSLSLVALMESSNNISPKAGERMSILWSHQNIFRALPTAKDVEYSFREESPSSSQPSAESIGSTMHAVTRAFPLLETHGDSSQPGVMKPRRNVPPLTISTTTRTTTTTITQVVTIQSPAKSSPASITVVSASATWSILELYGDSPKPSPKLPKLPKTSGHLDRSFKPSDLQFPSRPRLPPKSAFASNFPSGQLQSELTSSRIVELPADFVNPDLKPKLKGASSQMNSDVVKKHVALSGSRKNGKVRPLPQVPRDHSPPPPVPMIPFKVTSPPTPTTMIVSAAVGASNPSFASLPSDSESRLTSGLSASPFPRPHKSRSDVDSSQATLRTKKSALRTRMPPPPPLPLDSPLPALPPNAIHESEAPIEGLKIIAPLAIPKMQRSKAPESKADEVKETGKANGAKLEEKVSILPALTQSNEKEQTAGAPARPSRTNVISPLPSPVLERLHALESLPGKKELLSPPAILRHKPSASEPLPGSTDPNWPSLGPKKGLQKSSSISSMPRLTPTVYFPDASTLAKRLREDSATRIRPPLEPELHIIITGPEIQENVGKAPSVESNASGIREVDASLTSTRFTDSFPVSVSTPLVLDRDHTKTGIAQVSSSSFPLYSQSVGGRVDFPSVDRIPSPFRVTNPRQQSPAPKISMPQQAPLPTHRKGGSMSSGDARPAVKVHNKSSSVGSFRIPVVEHPFPDVATLAKRLAARKNPTGSLPSFKGKISDKNVSNYRPHVSSSASDSVIPRQRQKEGSNVLLEHTVLKSLSGSNEEDRNQVRPSAVPRPSHKKNASTSALHQKNDAGNRLIKKVSSHSSLRSPGTLSLAPDSAGRNRNGPLPMRRPIIHDVPLPDARMLAQRMKAPSATSSRPYGEVSDAFTPFTLSADVASALPQTRLNQGSSTQDRILLAAPEPVVATASWVHLPSKQLTESVSPPLQANSVPKNDLFTDTNNEASKAVSGRSRSVSGTKTAKAPLPPLPPHVIRGSPGIPVPTSDSVSRTPSPGPGILIRSKVASPAPSTMHVRFQSINKHPVPAVPVPIVKVELQKSLERRESYRGRQSSNAKVVSPRGRSVSVLPSSREITSSRRSVSVAASSRNHPLPPLPITPAEGYSSDSPVSAGSRGRVSPFPSRPVSRSSITTSLS